MFDCSVLVQLRRWCGTGCVIMLSELLSCSGLPQDGLATSLVLYPVPAPFNSSAAEGQSETLVGSSCAPKVLWRRGY